MRDKKNLRKNLAVSGVIEALLLVALASIILSTIQLTYIPQIMNDRESEHMDQVSNQFSYLKAMIEIQSITQSDVVISSPITLGSTELPYFITAWATGEITIPNDKFKITVNPGLAATYLGSIKYEAKNSYFIDQTYILEAGGVVLIQPDGSAMRVLPSISVENTSDVTLDFRLYNIEGVTGKDSSGGAQKETYYLYTNFSSSTMYPQFQNITSARVYTLSPNAWWSALNYTLGRSVNLSREISDDPEFSFYIKIVPNAKFGKPTHLDLEIVDIRAQVGPGRLI